MYWYNRIYNIKTVLITILISTVIFYSCTEKTTKPGGNLPSEAYFDIKGYFENEILLLSRTVREIEKTVGKDGDNETQTIHIKDWNRELSSFSAIDLNKPVYAGQFTVTQDSVSIHYTSHNPKLDIRSISIQYNGEEVSQIVINKEVDNMLYSTKERLEYSKNNFYNIDKTQSILVLGTSKYSIKGKLTEQN